ncbi:LysR family transcriptional regulator [Cereibacter sphaeroides]|uniref:LysR family transcriptional regulator n=1 Tax=Cereibacter sphaeroides TaxID=1063 RepID=UPI001F22277A|nr:LysR family transcriptional regulator [Cereibacter sphaeroides]MCE6957704.1 LysR family transcriptional regulator [Cereibacter sphaeroides]MCE6967270.1 LysR family transcriptional regulator [Cereibacter sphaeroides]MCE6971469.1 LysR family transcriptional regulator [Cereibacter sphaeroides]
MSDLSTRRLDIDALRVLRAIHQHGGITRAAEALGLTQSAVSHKVKRLETSLDCELLTRRSGAPLFTGAGEDLLDYAKRILGLHDEALLSLTRTDLAGRILLGLTEDTTCSDLSRILGRFHRLHPQVAVRTKVRMSLVLREMLDRGELDAAILQVFAHEVRPTDVVLFREALNWVKLAGVPLPEDGPIPFLCFDDDCFYRHWAMDIGQDDGALLETVFECASAAGIVAGVLAGLGIALISERHLRPEMEIIRTRLPSPPALAYVVRRARKTRNPALDSLVSEIEAGVSRSGGLSLVV